MNRRQFVKTATAAAAAAVAVLKPGEMRMEPAAFDGRPGLIAHVQGSAAQPYEIRRAKDGKTVYCSCPSWKYQSLPPTQRTCKHIRAMKAAIRKVA